MKIMNNKLVSPIKQLLLPFLIVLTCIFYFSRIIPKDFSSLLPGSDSIINGCIINSIGQKPLELDENDLIKFLSILKDTQYYYNGHYGDTLVGNLYRIEFLERNNGLQSVVLTMIISDEDIAYIGNKQYNIHSESISITDFLHSLY
ncbi:hypothetical protein [Clostridium lundense]|uniref:hypothetical protein n=1 Tax=Clostridium lundense TaxID=319475 RepID=UPI0004855039|nr:hypothetical protein [Clostridium lundense]